MSNFDIKQVEEAMAQALKESDLTLQQLYAMTDKLAEFERSLAEKKYHFPFRMEMYKFSHDYFNELTCYLSWEQTAFKDKSFALMYSSESSSGERTVFKKLSECDLGIRKKAFTYLGEFILRFTEMLADKKKSLKGVLENENV